MASIEYLHTYLVTFNCGRELINPTALAPHFFDGLQSGTVKSPTSKSASNVPVGQTQLPDLVVLNLQEIAPIAYSFLGGSFITPYLDRFRNLVDLAGHQGTTGSDAHEQPRYVNILARNIGLTAIMVFVRAELVSQIDGIMTAEVGVGVHETGHKGAVGVRLSWTIGDSTSSSSSSEESDTASTSLTFISAHLAPMEEKLERRNQDYKDIVKGLVFTSDTTSQLSNTKSGSSGADETPESAPLLSSDSPSSHSNSSSVRNGMYAPNSFMFFAGDLNYRTSIHPPSTAEVPSFPKLHVDPADKGHYLHLLERDQLSAARAKGDVLQGFSEEEIRFPPTYKYKYHPANPDQQIIEDNDIDSWEWASHRWPSWCDRILYWQPAGHENPSGSANDVLSKLEVKPQAYTALPMVTTSDHRPVALSVLVPLVTIPANVGKTFEDQAPAPLNKDWKAKRDAARRREIVVGIFSYLALTREGNALLVGSIAAIVGGWLISKSWGH